MASQNVGIRGARPDRPRGIGERRAHIAILDITDVPVIDAEIASALVKVAQAVKLLGATCVRPKVTQTIVSLGIDLQGIATLRSLQSGVAFAMKTEREGERGHRDQPESSINL